MLLRIIHRKMIDIKVLFGDSLQLFTQRVVLLQILRQSLTHQGLDRLVQFLQLLFGQRTVKEGGQKVSPTLRGPKAKRVGPAPGKLGQQVRPVTGDEEMPGGVVTIAPGQVRAAVLIQIEMEEQFLFPHGPAELGVGGPVGGKIGGQYRIQALYQIAEVPLAAQEEPIPLLCLQDAAALFTGHGRGRHSRQKVRVQQGLFHRGALRLAPVAQQGDRALSLGGGGLFLRVTPAIGDPVLVRERVHPFIQARELVQSQVAAPGRRVEDISNTAFAVFDVHIDGIERDIQLRYGLVQFIQADF